MSNSSLGYQCKIGLTQMIWKKMGAKVLQDATMTTPRDGIIAMTA
jgi:hypothetical protein